MRLLESEGLPIVWARPMLIGDMVASVHDKSSSGKARSRALAARALECVRLSAGEDHPSVRTVGSFLSVVDDFDSLQSTVAAGQQLAGAATARSTRAAAPARRAAKGKR